MSFYEDGIYALIQSWNTVIEKGVDYVEKYGCESGIYFYILMRDMFFICYVIKYISFLWLTLVQSDRHWIYIGGDNEKFVKFKNENLYTPWMLVFTIAFELFIFATNYSEFRKGSITKGVSKFYYKSPSANGYPICETQSQEDKLMI